MDYIVTEEGVKLSYTLSINDSNSPYLVILIHGTCGDKDNLFFPRLAEGLMFNTLRFDFEGNGNSGGKFMFGGFSREVDQIRSVVAWARGQAFKVVALVGHSKGGNLVLMYSSRYGDVPLVIPICGRMDMSILPAVVAPILDQVNEKGSGVIEFRGKQFTIDKEGVQERIQVNMRKVTEKVKTWVFVIHGTNDEVTQVKDSEDLEIALGKYCFERCVIEGADHFFREFGEELVNNINNFFKKSVPLLILRGKI